MSLTSKLVGLFLLVCLIFVLISCGSPQAVCLDGTHTKVVHDGRLDVVRTERVC